MQNKNDSTSYLGFILSLGISFFFVFYTFGFDFISGNASYWKVDGVDIAQHISGIYMYISSPWQFPLLAFDSLNYPQGTRVTFVDGIPAFALLLKIVLPRNVGFFNPLGYWIGLCFLLQGVSAWWISKELQVKSWFFLIFLVAVFLTYPALASRLRHAALMSHWILLFAIAIYLRGLRLESFPAVAWTVLLVLAFYIHIYLFVMAGGIYLVAIFENKQKITWLRCLFLFSPVYVLSASLFIFLLPVSSEWLVEAKGFDSFSMNLLAPFLGGKLIQVQAHIMPGQHEGINYLGLGVIIAVLLILFAWPTKCHQIFKKHWLFLLLMLAYAFYALSCKIYFSDKLVAVVNYSKYLDFITGQLRCSGRFFWPVGYAIIIFSITILYKKLNNRNFSILICILLFIQCVDISGFYRELKISRYRAYNPVIDYSVLDKNLNSEIKYIYFYPKFQCGVSKRRNLLAVMKYAASRHLKINTGYLARYRANCDDISSEIAKSSHFESIYIFIKTDYGDVKKVFDVMSHKQGIVCTDLDFSYVCHFSHIKEFSA